jgi:lipopolysaccharide transport system ATP-binding protein
MRPAIRVDQLSKQYRLGTGRQTPDGQLREVISDGVKRLVGRVWGRKGNPDGERPAGAGTFWALKDVSFEIQPGDVVGIIGRNGAGKSTLLKILSQIVEPTSGRAEVRGRMGSLLEVGTGFHPELTGRENVYLNGSILGMSRKEIDRKFDEIVAFSEIEQFLDTPVKRYSSGMYVRLAFAVAAHLEPEILVADEVLAVGDAEFQRKCLKRMSEIGSSGRTVLFVSHNLASVRSLCKKAILLENGAVKGYGEADAEVARYVSRLANYSRNALAQRTDREGTGQARAVAVRFLDELGHTIEHGFPGKELGVAVDYESTILGGRVDLAISCWNEQGVKLWHVDNKIRGRVLPRSEAAGTVTCTFRDLPLPPGQYYLNLALHVNEAMADHIYYAASFAVLPGDYYQTGRITPAAGALMYVNHEWQ